MRCGHAQRVIFCCCTCVCYTRSRHINEVLVLHGPTRHARCTLHLWLAVNGPLPALYAGDKPGALFVAKLTFACTETLQPVALVSRLSSTIGGSFLKGFGFCSADIQEATFFVPFRLNQIVRSSDANTPTPPDNTSRTHQTCIKTLHLTLLLKCRTSYFMDLEGKIRTSEELP